MALRNNSFGGLDSTSALQGSAGLSPRCRSEVAVETDAGRVAYGRTAQIALNVQEAETSCRL